MLEHFTARRVAGLLALWLSCVFLVPLMVGLGAFYGLIVGAAQGAAQGVTESWNLLRQGYKWLA